jgi:arabinosaccharide transport system permease protein
MLMSAEKIKSKRKTELGHFLYSQKIAPYVFVLPFIISFLVFFLGSTIQTVYMSFHRVLAINDMEFLGLRNYFRLNNVHYFNAIKNNTIYTILCVCTIIPASVILAVLLDAKFIHGRNAFRAIFFIPALTSVIVAGVAFRLIFGTLPTALANSFLVFLGFEHVNWVMNLWSGFVLLLSLSLWRITGIYMVYFLSALQIIPNELYESADIDGAGIFTRFFRITLPLIKPTAVYVLTLVIFEGYRMFSESWVFWPESTPGDIGLTMTRYIYLEAFRQNDMGFGSAIGITMLLIVLGINLIQLKFFGLFRKES